MASIIEVLNKLSEENLSSVVMQLVSGSVKEADRGSKRKLPSIKIVVPEEVAANYLSFGETESIGLLIHVDRKEWMRANKEIDFNNSVKPVSTNITK